MNRNSAGGSRRENMNREMADCANRLRNLLKISHESNPGNDRNIYFLVGYHERVTEEDLRKHS